jgi:hypothetical protein
MAMGRSNFGREMTPDMMKGKKGKKKKPKGKKPFPFKKGGKVKSC